MCSAAPHADPTHAHKVNRFFLLDRRQPPLPPPPRLQSQQHQRWFYHPAICQPTIRPDVRTFTDDDPPTSPPPPLPHGCCNNPTLAISVCDRSPSSRHEERISRRVARGDDGVLLRTSVETRLAQLHPRKCVTFERRGRARRADAADAVSARPTTGMFIGYRWGHHAFGRSGF